MNEYLKALDDEYCLLIKELYRLMLKNQNEGITVQEQRHYKRIEKAINKNISSYTSTIKS